MARWLVERHRPMIEAIADALARDGELDGAQIDALIAEWSDDYAANHRQHTGGRAQNARKCVKLLSDFNQLIRLDDGKKHLSLADRLLSGA